MMDRTSRGDSFVILDNVQFEKNYVQNRYRIVTRNGVRYLTIPVTASSTSMIWDVRIQHATQWVRKQMATLDQSYSKAPYYDQHRPFLQSLYEQRS